MQIQQTRMPSRGAAPAIDLPFFDLLHLDGRDLSKLPLLERKEVLETLLSQLPSKGPIRYLGHVQGNGPEFLLKPVGFGLRGSSPSLATPPTVPIAVSPG